MSEPLVVVALAYSGKAQSALVAVRIGNEEMKMLPARAVRLGQDIIEAAYAARLETDLTDFMLRRWKLSEEDTRAAIQEFRLHRADLERARRNDEPEVGGRGLRVEGIDPQ